MKNSDNKRLFCSNKRGKTYTRVFSCAIYHNGRKQALPYGFGHFWWHILHGKTTGGALLWRKRSRFAYPTVTFSPKTMTCNMANHDPLHDKRWPFAVQKVTFYQWFRVSPQGILSHFVDYQTIAKTQKSCGFQDFLSRIFLQTILQRGKRCRFSYPQQPTYSLCKGIGIMADTVVSCRIPCRQEVQSAHECEIKRQWWAYSLQPEKGKKCTIRLRKRTRR